MTSQLLFLLAAALWNNRQAGPGRCGFDEQRLSFAGSPIEVTQGYAKGLFLHSELNQVWLSEPSGPPGNFSRAPVPASPPPNMTGLPFAAAAG
jgi:hypothetical protein